jgi:predicted transcriptional regulator/DNA-binding XRE family transcriptional regulator
MEKWSPNHKLYYLEPSCHNIPCKEYYRPLVLPVIQKGNTMSNISGKTIEAKSINTNDPSQTVGLALKKLRKISGLTQQEMSKRLNVGQASISKIEKRGDLQVSTIQKYVEALGAKLHIDASFDPSTPLGLSVRNTFDLDYCDDNQIVLPIFGEDNFKPRRDVVLSIKPQYSSKIISGLKTVELRRRFPTSAPKGTMAYIYSTSPTMAMVGIAQIKEVIKISTSEIWDRFNDVAFIEKADFENYFKGVDEGCVIKFSNAHAFKNPLPLSELRARFGFEPPQSFLYAKLNLREALKDEQTIVPY